MSKKRNQRHASANNTLTLPQARKRAQRHPTDPNAWLALGRLLAEHKDWENAREALEKAHNFRPENAEQQAWLGYIAYHQNRTQDAIRYSHNALSQKPELVLGLATLAKLHINRGEFQKSLEYAQKAYQTSPHDIPIIETLAISLSNLYRYEEALKLYCHLTEKTPQGFSSWNNAGNMLRDLGRLKEAYSYYKRAIKVGNHPFPYSNYLTALHYDPEVSREEIMAFAKSWEERFSPAQHLVPSRPKRPSAAPTQLLRLGLISDGLRNHPVGKMITRCLENLPAKQFELYCYTTNDTVDSFTKRIQHCAQHWQSIRHSRDEEFAQQILYDEIDILIDLSGHNTGSRMQAIALQPAPLIVKWVGGLINTTGVQAIDYLISDHVETPEGEDAYYTEKLIRLPDDYIVFDPPEKLPTLGELPAKQNGYITLACFNNPTKLNDVALKQWASIMHELPDSRLMLKGRPYTSESFCERLYTTLEAEGIARERLIIEGPGNNYEMLDAYNRADIALDPWPYSGGLTTCESFIMGVPVVTLPGPTFAGRHSATHLVHAGMPELVVNSWEEYRARVIELASDLDSLGTIRQHLRDVLLQSPVCDGPRFAKHFTDAMRAIWQRYCDDKPPAALTFNKEGEARFEDEDAPVEIHYAEASEDDSTFQWQFEGKLITVDNGGQLLESAVMRQLLQREAIELIAFDPSSQALDTSLKQHTGVHYYPNTTLGDGQPGQLHACLDPKLSATLAPLGDEHQPEAIRKGSQVLTQLPLNTIALDSIQGLPAIDWLVLDDLNDATAILDNGTQALKDTLLLQVKVTFQPTHERQPSLAELQHWASRNGFRFYRLHEPQHRSHLPEDVPETQRQATELTSANALLLPSHARMEALSDNQRMRLAFLLHTVFGMKDVAYVLLTQASTVSSNNYLEELNFNNPIANSIDSSILKIKKPSKDSHQIEEDFNNIFSSEGLKPETRRLAQRLNTALNGRKLVFLATGNMANHGIVQKGQEDLFDSLKSMGVDVAWANYKKPLTTKGLINLVTNKNYIFYGSNRYYDASVNISGISNQNLFDAFGSPIAAFLGDHPYARFMIERIAKAPKIGLLYGHKSLTDEARFLRPDMPYIQAWSIEPKPTLVLDKPINHFERDIDILVPINLSFAINSETLYNNIKQQAKALGKKHEKLVANVIDTYNDFSISLLDHFRATYKEIFDREWHVNTPWTRADRDLIWLLGGLDDVIRGRKRLEALKMLSSLDEDLNIFVLAQETEKEVLTKIIGSKKINDWIFCGNQHADALDKLYKRSRYVLSVNPTYHDSIHERVRNAAAAGCAIITNKSEKLSSIFKNNKDILFYDANKFPKVNRNDVEASECIGSNANEKIKRLYADRQHTEILKIYVEYIEKINMTPEK